MYMIFFSNVRCYFLMNEPVYIRQEDYSEINLDFIDFVAYHYIILKY